MSEEQTSLGIDDVWAKEWKGMPEFNMRPEVPMLTIKISFKAQEDIDAFSEIFGQKVKHNLENYWFPKLNRKSTSELKYVDE